MKKTWTTPQLVALVRGQPEEAVLTICKVPKDVGPGVTTNGSPDVANGGCQYGQFGTNGALCKACDSLGFS